MRQDTWASFLLPSGMIKGPQGQGLRQGHGLEDEGDPVFASSSYNWVLNTISLYLREVWVLIRGDCIHDPRAHTGIPSGEEKEMDGRVASMSYSRGDLCEVSASASFYLFSFVFVFISLFIFIFIFTFFTCSSLPLHPDIHMLINQLSFSLLESIFVLRFSSLPLNYSFLLLSTFSFFLLSPSFSFLLLSPSFSFLLSPSFYFLLLSPFSFFLLSPCFYFLLLSPFSFFLLFFVNLFSIFRPSHLW